MKYQGRIKSVENKGDLFVIEIAFKSESKITVEPLFRGTLINVETL